jgi:hypothetical protein
LLFILRSLHIRQSIQQEVPKPCQEPKKERERRECKPAFESKYKTCEKRARERVPIAVRFAAKENEKRIGRRASHVLVKQRSKASRRIEKKLWLEHFRVIPTSTLTKETSSDRRPKHWRKVFPVFSFFLLFSFKFFLLFRLSSAWLRRFQFFFSELPDQEVETKSFQALEVLYQKKKKSYEKKVN